MVQAWRQRVAAAALGVSLTVLSGAHPLPKQSHSAALPAVLPEKTRPSLFPGFLRVAPRAPSGEGGQALQKAYARLRNGYETGDFQPGIDAFREVLRENPQAAWTGEATWYIAEGYHRMGFYSEAASYWAKVLALYPIGERALDAESALAESLYRVDRLKEATVHFQRLSHQLSRPAERGWAMVRNGDCLLGLGLAQEALARYLQAQPMLPASEWSPESLIHLASIYLDRGEPQQALVPIMTALSLYPDQPQPSRWLYLLAEALIRTGRPLEGAFVLDRLLSVHPEAKEAEMAEIRLATLALSQAGRPLVIAMGPSPARWSDPSHPIFHEDPKDVFLQGAVLNLSRGLQARGDLQGAFGTLLNACRGFDESSVMPTIRGTLLYVARQLIREVHEKDPAKAVQIFDAASRWSNEIWADGEILLDVGRSAERSGFYALAASLYRKIGESKHRLHTASDGYMDQFRRRSTYGGIPLKREKKGVALEATLGLMRVSLKRGEADAALELLGMIPPDQSWKRMAQGILSWVSSTQRPEDAAAAAQWLEDAPSGVWTQETLAFMGRWYLAQSAYGDGVQFLRGALENAPWTEGAGDGREAWSVLCDLLAHQPEPVEAMACYERLLNGRPWGILEKWAAYRIVQMGIATNQTKRVRPYLKELLEEPEESLWRNLAELFRRQLGPQNPQEDTPWS